MQDLVSTPHGSSKGLLTDCIIGSQAPVKLMGTAPKWPCVLCRYRRSPSNIRSSLVLEKSSGASKKWKPKSWPRILPRITGKRQLSASFESSRSLPFSRPATSDHAVF